MEAGRQVIEEVRYSAVDRGVGDGVVIVEDEYNIVRERHQRVDQRVEEKFPREFLARGQEFQCRCARAGEEGIERGDDVPPETDVVVVSFIESQPGEVSGLA